MRKPHGFCAGKDHGDHLPFWKRQWVIYGGAFIGIVWIIFMVDVMLRWTGIGQ